MKLLAFLPLLYGVVTARSLYGRKSLVLGKRTPAWQRISRGGSDVPLPTPPDPIPVPPPASPADGAPPMTDDSSLPTSNPPTSEAQLAYPDSPSSATPPAVVTEEVVPVVPAKSAIALKPIVSKAIKDLGTSLQGKKSDALLLLSVTALVPTVCAALKTSPILGYLVSGLALGPQGLNLVSDLHTTELLADLGVVLFLFEMGVHLSLKTLWDMRSIVFGLGGLQMLLTGGIVAAVARACGLNTASQVVLGGGLALSSSAFVLQLLKDSQALETTKGKHSFGILLLQDLAVVPLLVVTPLLAGNGDTSVSTAVVTALIQFVMALTAIGAFGTVVMPSLFDAVLKVSKSQEATIAVSLATILGMSFLTEGLGLSNTLGAFLAGVLLSETPFRHAIETEVSPFRGILVGLFFFSVGFEIDLPLIFSKEIKTIASIVLGLMLTKTLVTTLLCKVFGLDFGTAQSIGLLLSQGGEFGFVAFRLARSLKIFDPHLTKIMLTSVSLTMALTPMAEGLGGMIASLLSKKAKLA